jgi:guanylate kinase
MSTGTLYIVSAPSGAGKTSLVAALRERDPALGLAVSYTTRAPRAGEQHGVHYYYVDEPEFMRMVAEGAFLEHATVFGNRYGTAEHRVRSDLEQGRDLLLEIDWQGARQVRKRFPAAVSIFVMPPSEETLEQRLRGRRQDSDQVIAGRMAQARSEMSHYREYDYLVVNDLFADALAQITCLVTAERLRTANSEARLPQSLRRLAADS